MEQTKIALETKSDEILDEKVESRCAAPIITKARDASQTYLSMDQFMSVYEYAAAAWHRDHTRGQIERELLAQETLDEKDRLNLENGFTRFSLDSLYRIAGEHGIDENYIKMSMRILDPSPEQQLEDILNAGVLPTKEVLVRAAGKGYSQRLHQCLSAVWPRHQPSMTSKSYIIEESTATNFDNYGGHHHRLLISEVLPPVTLWQKLVKKRGSSKALAKVGILYSGFNHSNQIVIDVFDPRFLSACGDALNELKKFWSNRYEITTRMNYVIESSRFLGTGRD